MFSKGSVIVLTSAKICSTNHYSSSTVPECTRTVLELPHSDVLELFQICLFHKSGTFAEHFCFLQVF